MTLLPVPANGGTLVDYLVRAIDGHPDRQAVRDRHRHITYTELDQMCNGVTELLVSSGVTVGSRIGIWLNKSVTSVAAIHAVLRAGAAYVPIDPIAPPLRAARILTDSEAIWLITTRDRVASIEASAPETLRLVSLLLVGEQDTRTPGPTLAPTVAFWTQTVEHYSATKRVIARVCADDVAYILYTSGSTGTPKGVVLTHGNARAFVDWASGEFALGHADVLASHAPLHFDLSTFDLFGAAASGACVSLVPESWQGLGAALSRFIAHERITVWYSVPSALQRIVEADGSGSLAESWLRVVAFAGEEYPVRHLRRLAALLPRGTALYNLYGPTETNVCTYHRVGTEDLVKDAAKSVPIGRMCPYARAVLRNQDGRLLTATAADGAEFVGELCVAGRSVMKGYWNDVDKTASSTFTQDGIRYYRTGDTVRQSTNGVYTFVGRFDDMVKVKGHRIELGEIEAALDSRPEVREAVCVVMPGPNGEPVLVAFVTAANEGMPEERSLLRHCRKLLPGYMVPERIEIIRELCYTSTGKINRRSMALIAAGAVGETACANS